MLVLLWVRNVLGYGVLYAVKINYIDLLDVFIIHVSLLGIGYDKDTDCG